MRFPQAASLAFAKLPALAFALLACDVPAGAPIVPPGAADAVGDDDDDDDGDDDDHADGAALYALHCASCHGNAAEGTTSAPRLAGWNRERAELVDVIITRMPPGDPSVCDGACAELVADFILSLGAPPPLDCSEEPLAPPQLRLLTRFEYDRTIRDLFAPATSAPVSACDVVTFAFEPNGTSHSSVHVAGSFNGWPSTIAAGGWPLTFDAATGRWRGEHHVDDGDHQYKLVLDEATWITDPANPAHVADGFGGQNSVLTQDCAAASPGSSPASSDVWAQAWSQAFPPETRPGSFPFDDNAAAALVTSVHIEEALNAAARIADLATANVPALVGCAPGPACADSFVRSFGKRAFRRALDEQEAARFTALITSAPTFAEGVAIALRVMLSSPSFLYRSELGVPAASGAPAATDRARLTGDEIAASMSYALWATLPDQALLDAAAAGSLDTSAGREQQARRMLADPRARDVAGRFVVQWLGVEGLPLLEKSAGFSAFNEAVRAAMLEETRRSYVSAFFESDGHRFAELLTGTTTQVNATLASFYGLPAPSSTNADGFGAVPLDERRAGLLTHGSVLSVMAYPDQTSPVRRGLFVRRRLLCQDLGTPPPNAGAVPSVDPDSTTRERFEQHRNNPQCFACHQYVDDVGFGFERFDPVGRVRSLDNGQPIDDTGDMNDVEGLGTHTSAPFTSLRELATTLAHSEAAPACYARQMFRFVRGRLETADDACTLDRVRRAFDDSGGDMIELVVAIVRDESFVLRSNPNEGAQP